LEPRIIRKNLKSSFKKIMIKVNLSIPNSTDVLEAFTKVNLDLMFLFE